MTEIFQGSVRSLTFKGLGVVDHPSGRVYFVRGVWPGDEGEFEVLSTEKRYGYARIIKITQFSPERAEPSCQHLGFESGRCGGCPWMIADYDAQLREKNRMVRHLLDKHKILSTGSIVHPIIGAEKQIEYRNRAQFKTNGNKMGYVSTGTNDLAPIEKCIVLTSKLQDKFEQLKNKLPNEDWIPEKNWAWNFLEVDEETDIDGVEVNRRRPFKQGNSQQNQIMKIWVEDVLKNQDKQKVILELFCGDGNFTEILSKLSFKKIVAAEGSSEAIDRLSRRGYQNVQGLNLNLYRPSSWSELKKNAGMAEVLLLDPPREGFPDIHKFVKTLGKIKQIIYISCDPNTYVVDVKKLISLGFVVDIIQPIDQFPQTPHIEILSQLSLRPTEKA